MNDDLLELRMWRDGNIMHGNCLEDMNKLKAERDEARRDLCVAEAELRENRPCACSPQDYANRMKWDCFKSDNLSQEVSQEGCKEKQ
jgi:hypothetical protein